MKNDIIEVNRSSIIQAAKDYPHIKDILNTVFPTAFEQEKVFCRIGDIVLRKGHNSFYAVINKQGFVRLINIEHSHEWKDSIKESECTGFKYGMKENFTITLGEFNKLTGGLGKGFVVVPKNEIIEKYGK